MTTAESVLLPAPFGPITAWTSPLDTVEVDAAQDLLAADGGPQALDLQRRHDAPPTWIVTVSPSTSVRNTGTGCVAGSVSGSPVTRLNVLPCFGHSISRSSHHTSPSDSETLAWLQMSPMA